MKALVYLIPILLPIVGGFLIIALKFKDDRARNIYAETIVCLTSIAVWCVILLADGEPVEVYSFTRGFSVDFGMDGLTKLFAGMVSVMWPPVMLYAFSYMRESRRKNMFFAFYVMTYGVTLGIAFASNMTTLYVFYEMLSLVTIPLVSHYEDHESMYAGRVYAAFTIGGASLAFFSVVMTTVYGNAGNFLYGGNLQPEAATSMMLLAFIFGFFGFGTKAAVFPLYYWLPTASVAPTPVTALLHAVAVVNAGVFAVVRMTWYSYGPDFLRGTWAQNLALAAAVFTLVFAAVLAVRERHFKRRLAFSTVSNLSYMLFGVMLLNVTGLMAGLAHMLFHGIIKISLFMCAGAFMHTTGNSYVYEVNGVGRKMPVTFTCFTLGALSLTGVPLFCGFVSKWQLLRAGAQAGTLLGYLGVAGLLVSAFLCAMYTLTISARAFFPVVEKNWYEEDDRKLEADRLMLIPIVLFSVLNIVFGVVPGPVLDFLGKIAAGL